VFFKTHKASVEGVVAIVGRQSVLEIWRLWGSGGLLRPNAILTARHVAEAALDLTQTGTQSAKTSREAWVIFNADASKFPNGIPSSYDPTSDTDAIRISVGSEVLVPSNINIDLALIKIPPQGQRTILALDSNALNPKDQLAVVGVPGKPDGKDALDPYSDIIFRICGRPDDSWATAVRIVTGAYLGLDEAPQLFQFRASTLGGDSGAMVFDARSGRVQGVSVGSPDNQHLFYNLAVRREEVNALLPQL
jgi:hypothetical protein